MRCPRTRSAAVLLAVVLCTCTDSPTGPRHLAGRLSLAPVYSRQAHEIAKDLATANLTIDKVFVEVRGPAGDVRASELVDFPANQQQTTVSLKVSLKAPQEQLTANLELRSGTTPIFSSTTPVEVQASQTTQAQSDTLIYVGPGKEATALNVQPSQATIGQSGSQQFAAVAFAADESPVTNLPITGWTSSDSTIATVTAAGLAQGIKTGTVTITAHALNLLTASASLRVVGLPAHVTVLSGDGQTGVVGTTLAQSFKVQLLSEAGEPVPGVTVNFQSVTQGGSVATATATTDAQGTASTTVTVGNTAGSYVFRAFVASGSLNATITATAQSGAASAIAKVSGDAQSGAAGQLLPSPLVVRVSDAFGNPVGGVNVTFTRLTGTGSIGTPSVTTGPDGLASTSYSLGPTAGGESVRAQIAGLTGVAVTFTMTTTAGPASRLALVRLPSSPTTSGAAFASQPAVQLHDASDNIVAQSGVTITATVANGYSTVGTATATTDGTGTATFTNLGVSGPAGQVTIAFTASGLTSATTVVVVTAGTAASMAAAPNVPTQIAGQIGTPVATSNLPAVLVRDAAGNAVSGVGVTFTLSSGGGTITPATPAIVATNASGIAALAGWTLPSTTGMATVTATLTGVSGSPLVFTATVTAGAPGSITKIAGDGQNAAVNATLPNAPTVVIKDASGNAVPGAAVTFTAGGNNGAVSIDGQTFAANVTVTTDATGSAHVTWRLGTLAGPQSLVATVLGLTAVTFGSTANAGIATQLAIVTPPSSPTASNATFTTQPVVQRRDQFGNPVLQSGVSVAASVPSTYTLVGSASTTTDVNGTAAFSSLGVSGPVGPAVITFSSAGLTSATATVSIVAGTPASIAPTVAVQFSGSAGAPVPSSLLPSVLVLDGGKNPVQGVGVTFSVSLGAITPANPATVVTDASGIAKLSAWTLPTASGTSIVTATLNGATGSPVVFTATVTAGAAAAIVKTAGDVQSATVNTALSTQPSIAVRDANGNGISGVQVTFTAGNTGAVSGDGTNFAPNVIVSTDATGSAKVGWRLGTQAGNQSLTVSALTLTPVTFSATATAGAATQLAVVTGPSASVASGGIFGTQPVIQRRDQFGNAVPAAGVTVMASVPQPYSTTGASASTDATGTAAFSALGVTGPAGQVTITFASANVTTVTSAVTVTAGAVASIAANSSTQLAGQVGTAVAAANLPAVIVKDGAQNPVPGAGVTFTVSGGAITPTSPATVTTDANGIAKVSGWTLPTTTGTATVTATLANVSGSPVVFTVTVTAGAPGSITKSAGDGQTSTVNTTVPNTPTVVVKDGNGNVVPNVAVVFTAGANGGSVSIDGQTFNTSATVNTDAAGSAHIVWRLGTQSGAQTLSASVAGLTSVAFSATATPGAVTQLVVTRAPNSPTASGAAFTTQPAIQQRDQFGNAVSTPSATVTASVPAGTPFTLVGTTSATTDGTGTATFTTLGVSGPVGLVTLTFTAGNLTTTASVSVTAGAAASIAPNVATQLSGAAGGAVASASLPAVIVKDAANNPVPGVAVTFTASGGTTTPTSPATVQTGSNGVAALTGWTLPTTAGTATVTATLAGTSGSPVTFTATVSAGAATQLAVVTAPNSPSPSGAPFTTQPAMQLRDQLSNPVLVSGISVTASVPAGSPVTLVGNTTATTNANGTATFASLGVNGPAGQVTITFSSSGVTSVTSQVTIAAGAAASIAPNVSTQLLGTAGSSVTTAGLPAVLVKDAAQNPVPGVGVTFTVSGGSIMPTSPATVMTDANGVAKISGWTLPTTTGVATVTVTLAGVTGNPVTFTASITAGAAAKLAIGTSPSSPTAVGAAFATQPIVQLVDQFGNVASTSGVVVTANVPSGHTLVGTTTSTSNANGAAAFTNLGVIGVIGTTTLTFTAQGLTSTATSITLTVGAASQITKTAGDNQQGLVSTNVTTPPTVAVKDAGGNAVANTAVTFTVASGGGLVNAGGAAFTTSVQVNTNANGAASVTWQLGATAGTNTLIAALKTGGSVTFTATANAGFTLTIGGTGGQLGTITSSPGNINCSIQDAGNTGTCSQVFATGTMVSLTATPAPGNFLQAWSNACANFGTTNPCTLTMNAAQVASANFVQGFKTITLHNSAVSSAIGVVTSSPSGISCTLFPADQSGTCSAQFPSLTSVTLTANPNPGAVFSSWSGACTGTSPTCVLSSVVQGTLDVTAVFVLAPASPGRPPVTPRPPSAQDNDAQQERPRRPQP